MKLQSTRPEQNLGNTDSRIQDLENQVLRLTEQVSALVETLSAQQQRPPARSSDQQLEELRLELANSRRVIDAYEKVLGNQFAPTTLDATSPQLRNARGHLTGEITGADFSRVASEEALVEGPLRQYEQAIGRTLYGQERADVLRALRTHGEVTAGDRYAMRDDAGRRLWELPVIEIPAIPDDAP